MVDFSEREKELMAYAWQCFDEEPKIQYAKLAEMAGMTNAGSAANAWRTIKKKLATISGANAGGGTAGDGDVTATTKATPKRKKAVGEDGGTPAKKARATRKKTKKATADDSADQEEDDEAAKVKAEASEGDSLV